jgi:hypothetical protein
MDLAQKIVIAVCAIIAVGVLCQVFPPLTGLKGFGEKIVEASIYLIIALFIAVAVLTGGERHQRQMLILAVCMAIASVIIFVVLLGQAMPTFTGDYLSAAFSKIASLFTSAKGA